MNSKERIKLLSGYTKDEIEKELKSRECVCWGDIFIHIASGNKYVIKEKRISQAECMLVIIPYCE